MSKNLENKVVVVTGGSQGIGRGICECFLQAGAIVIIADLRSPLDLVEWQLCCDKRLSWIETDVASTASIKTMAMTIDKQFGGVDVLINNAGIMFEKSIDEQTESDWDSMMGINLKGPMMVTKYLCQPKA